jgi:Domain of unknown function (DUF4249)
MSKRRIQILLCCLTLILWRCKDAYVSPYKAPQTGYLVVEGFISGNTATQFTLSQSIPLPGDSTIPKEDGATVQVEGNDNMTYPLKGQGNGVYSSVDTLALNPQVQYRLRIGRSNGEQYLSSFVPYKVTPAFDSVSWVNTGGTVQIYANTHDPSNNTRYYQWEYYQTWEYRSAQESFYMFVPGDPQQIVSRPDSLQIYTCWENGNSTSLLLGNTTKLAQDLVFEAPLVSIPPNNVELGILYTILVKQYALTADGYNFLSIMQKNTESLGSIFDLLPSGTVSNIQCQTNSKEQVIGWVSAGTVQQQRIWISRAQVPSIYEYKCQQPDTVLPDDSASIVKNFGGYGIFTPIYYFAPPAPKVGWDANYSGCIDCRLQGGTTTKPPFWPN